MIVIDLLIAFIVLAVTAVGAVFALARNPALKRELTQVKSRNRILAERLAEVHQYAAAGSDAEPELLVVKDMVERDGVYALTGGTKAWTTN